MRIDLVHQPDWGSGCWVVELVSDNPNVGTLASLSWGGRAHAGACRKGAEAYLRGEFRNPYDWARGIGLAQLGRRGFRNAWQEGWTTAQTLAHSERRHR